jgi:microfibrillar-associated protein 1
MWKIRELKRIRRDREERQKRFYEEQEISRRRQMNN